MEQTELPTGETSPEDQHYEWQGFGFYELSELEGKIKKGGPLEKEFEKVARKAGLLRGKGEERVHKRINISTVTNTLRLVLTCPDGFSGEKAIFRPRVFSDFDEFGKILNPSGIIHLKEARPDISALLQCALDINSKTCPINIVEDALFRLAKEFRGDSLLWQLEEDLKNGGEYAKQDINFFPTLIEKFGIDSNDKVSIYGLEKLLFFIGYLGAGLGEGFCDFCFFLEGKAEFGKTKVWDFLFGKDKVCRLRHSDHKNQENMLRRICGKFALIDDEASYVKRTMEHFADFKTFVDLNYATLVVKFLETTRAVTLRGVKIVTTNHKDYIANDHYSIMRRVIPIEIVRKIDIEWVRENARTIRGLAYSMAVDDEFSHHIKNPSDQELFNALQEKRLRRVSRHKRI